MIFLGHHSFPCQEDSWFTSNLTLIIYTFHTLLMLFGCWYDACRGKNSVEGCSGCFLIILKSVFFLPYFTSYIILLLGWTRIDVFYWWPNVFMIICKDINLFTYYIHCAKWMLFLNKFPYFSSIFLGEKSIKHYYNTIFPSQKLMENKGIYWKHLLVAVKLPLGTTVDMLINNQWFSF